MSIFKSCDIRGIYNDELTPAFALDLGRAIGTEMAGGSVVVGGDPRPSTPYLKGALLEGLLNAGCHVVDVGLVPTSALYFAQKWLQTEGAVMVTASHNPPEYNGFKLQLGSWPITEQALQGLRQRIGERDFQSGHGYWQSVNILQAYQADLESFFEPMPGLHVIVDAGNGGMSELAPTILRGLGVQVSERFCQIDGRFPNRNPNPAVAAHIAGLAEQVVAAGADVGVAYDGDGDRAVFVDNTGRVLPGDRALVPLIRHRLATAQTLGERTVVYDIKCSSVVAEEIAQRGGVPRLERSGHAFIKTTLLQEQAGLAGEISGHYFFGELGRDDALYATLLMLQIVGESGRSLAALLDEVPRYPITPDLRLPCEPAERTAILMDLQTAFQEHEISLVDGVRISFGDGWALARASVTEPLLTLRFEGRSEARLHEIQAEVVRRVSRLGQLFDLLQ